MSKKIVCFDAAGKECIDSFSVESRDGYEIGKVIKLPFHKDKKWEITHTALNKKNGEFKVFVKPFVADATPMGNPPKVNESIENKEKELEEKLVTNLNKVEENTNEVSKNVKETNQTISESAESLNNVKDELNSDSSKDNDNIEIKLSKLSDICKNFFGVSFWTFIAMFVLQAVASILLFMFYNFWVSFIFSLLLVFIAVGYMIYFHSKKNGISGMISQLMETMNGIKSN